MEVTRKKVEARAARAMLQTRGSSLRMSGDDSGKFSGKKKEARVARVIRRMRGLSVRVSCPLSV